MRLIQYECEKLAKKYQYVNRAACAYAHFFFFGNKQGVCLLEHAS